ncbi:MAG TPA: methyltransferase domain-containing protein [Actinomycetota bacterium]|nr:methyltransferase domain-containing protein [Actinomycetota bacterium]
MTTAPIFERLAERYDAWYDGPVGRVVFPLEVACLRPLLEALPPPGLEVGVGSGRFARALGVGYGVDPAHAPLRLAAARGVRVVQGVGERLPFRDASFGAVLIVVTLCFADDPSLLLREARRVLRPAGGVALGDVFAESAWGRRYRELGEAGHPFYGAARFLTREELAGALRAAGLRVVRARSTLRQSPTDAPAPEPVIEGDDPDAGFVGWLAVPA